MKFHGFLPCATSGFGRYAQRPIVSDPPAQLAGMGRFALFGNADSLLRRDKMRPAGCCIATIRGLPPLI
jgi:hypothetical protein